MIIYPIDTCPQGSDDWFAARCGRLTSSNAAAVLSLADLFEEKGRDTSKGREDLIWRLAAERVTGVPATDGFTTEALDRGTKLEPEARLVYAERHPEVEVREVGFVAHETRLTGTSPDGVCYVGDALVGGLEAKCPFGSAHMRYKRLEGETGIAAIPRDYVRQVLHHLLETGAEWWDFLSYHPAMPGRMAVYEARLEREVAHEWLDRYAAAVVDLLNDVDRAEVQMREGM